MTQLSAPSTCNACGRLNRAEAMFCSGCVKRLPSFVASAPSVLETMKRRALDASKTGASSAAVTPIPHAVGFPLWLPAVLLAMCAAFIGWVASKNALGPARLQTASPFSPERNSPAVSPCRATATVETEVVGGRTFIRRIQATC